MSGEVAAGEDLGGRAGLVGAGTRGWPRGAGRGSTTGGEIGLADGAGRSPGFVSHPAVSPVAIEAARARRTKRIRAGGRRMLAP